MHANKTIDSYWIQVRGLGDCATLGVQQLAILRYKGARSKPLLQTPSYNEALPQGLVSIQIDLIVLSHNILHY